MGKAKLNDITNFVIYDYKNFKYKLVDSFDSLPFYMKGFLEGKVNHNNYDINIPTINDILLEVYPFIDSPSPEIINNIIKRNRRVLEIVENAVKTKKSEKLVFDDLGEKDKFIIQLAKEFVFDLNKMIYKYEIVDLYANKTFINADVQNLYIGNIDILAKSKDGEWFIVSLKTSKTNFTQKYMGDLYLQKIMIENNTKLKISKMFIMNPRQERYLLDYNDISTGEKYEISSILGKSE